MPPEATSHPPGNLARRLTFNHLKEEAIRVTLAACALLSILTTLAIIFILFTETVAFFRAAEEWNAEYNRSVASASDESAPRKTLPAVVEFVTDPEWTPEQANVKHFGIRPLVIGTLMVAGIAALIGIPIGLATALYLSEYAGPRVRNFVKPTLEMLAGVPTVVYGYFAMLFITPYVLMPIFKGLLGLDVEASNAAAGGIAVGIMIIPMVSSLSEDVLRSVPRGLREAAYALGATKFEVSVRVVLPAALSGILASFLLAFARAVGETMAVTIAAGNQATGSFNPLRTTQTMTAYIVAVSSGEASSGTVEYYSLYAVGAALFVITLTTNILAQWILSRYREVYH